MHSTHRSTSHFVERSGTITLHGAPDEVFPLFGPEREREWAEGWEPEAVYPAVVAAQEGAVFLTRHGGDAVWVVNRYDESARVVAYTNFRHENRVTRVLVAVEGSRHEGRSSAHVTYAITALSEKGAQYIAHLTEEHYQSMMVEWETSINDLLSRKSKAAPDDL